MPPGRLVLLGHPVSHSLSPAFQNAALRQAGIPVVYEALDVEPANLATVFHALIASGAAGNVTVPHKAAVAALCGRLSASASRTGAVNTFWRDEDLGAAVGDNTDVAGYTAMAVTLLGAVPSGARIALLGAGGGAAAVCAAVEAWPDATVRVWSRSPARATALGARFPRLVQAAGNLGDALAGATIVVNATPVGLAGEEMPVPPGELPCDAAVMDLAYRAGETTWVRRARAEGHRAADGLEMLLAQGALAFERWFGITPDLGVMRRAVGA